MAGMSIQQASKPVRHSSCASRQWVVTLSILALPLLALTMQCVTGTADDAWFYSMLEEQDIVTLLISRYFTWTSRILLEITLLPLTHAPMLWRLLNTAIALLGVGSMARLSGGSYRLVWPAALLFLVLPSSAYNSSGWITMTVNYLWPLSLGLCALLPVRTEAAGGKVRWYAYALGIPALLFAANHEQLCMALVAIIFIITIYGRRRFGKMPSYTFVCLFVVTASLMFILTCPGNAVRRVSDASYWMPEWEGLSLPQRIEMAWSSTLFYYIMKPEPLFLCLCALVVLNGWRKHRRFLMCLPGAVALVATLFLGTFGEQTARLFPFLETLRNAFTKYGTLPFEAILGWVPDILLTGVALCALVGLLLACRETRHGAMGAYVMLCGIGTRMAAVFAPAVSDRTYFFLHFAIVYCILLLLHDLETANIVGVKCE